MVVLYKDKASALKKFIENAFTSEAKAARIPYYFLAICILLTVICIELGTANRYLKRIANGGATYRLETKTEANDPYKVFSEETEPTSDEASSTEDSSSKDVTSSTKDNTTENAVALNTSTTSSAKPQGNVRSYVVNKSSKKIHYSDCSYAERIKDDNKLVLNITEDELQSNYLSNGYTFCSKCGG